MLPPTDPTDPNTFDPDFCTPTRKQEDFLDRHRLHPDRAVDFYEAAHTIRTFVDFRRQLTPTAKQEKLLREHGKWRDGMTRGQAFDQIRALFSRPRPT